MATPDDGEGSTSGERDLARILGSLTIDRRKGAFTFVTMAEPVALGPGIEALITEAEGTTAVVSIAEAARRGWTVGFCAAWLTVQVHTALDGVGLTAALAQVLADHAMPCNILAGFYHDHLLVPEDRCEEAIDLLGSLADRGH